MVGKIGQVSRLGAIAVGVGALVAEPAAGSVFVQLINHELHVAEPGQALVPVGISASEAKELFALVHKLGGSDGPVAVPVNHLIVADGGLNTSSSRTKKA
jgi:hypothetical protein